MPWSILFDDAFAAEFADFDRAVQVTILKYAAALESEGPALGRPFADTLKGSKHVNMKELRPTVNKVEWRVAFAFDRQRQAILLAAGAKGGKKDARFYKSLIKTADERFDAHLERSKKSESEE
jgi:hypothetical protein